MSSLNRTASWIIRNKDTKAVLCETFNPEIAAKCAPGTHASEFYEAIPILEYLQSINGKPKP